MFYSMLQLITSSASRCRNTCLTLQNALRCFSSSRSHDGAGHLFASKYSGHNNDKLKLLSINLPWMPSGRVTHVSLAHGIHTSVRYDAGHSHWQNTRHIKEAGDLMKQRTANDVVRKMRLAVREGGGSTDPKTNSLLAKVIAEGHARNVPKQTMIDNLKRLEKSKIGSSVVYIEARGIGNCKLIVEACTDRVKMLRQEVQHILKPYGGTVGANGSSSNAFNLKGVVYLPVPENRTLSTDQALELALEAGAEEVQKDEDESDTRVIFKFFCEPRELHAVKRELESKGHIASEARLEYLPHTFVMLDDSALTLASTMLDRLEDLDTVVQVFENIRPVEQS